jgi:hypothetical protein
LEIDADFNIFSLAKVGDKARICDLTSVVAELFFILQRPIHEKVKKGIFGFPPILIKTRKIFENFRKISEKNDSEHPHEKQKKRNRVTTLEKCSEKIDHLDGLNLTLSKIKTWLYQHNKPGILFTVGYCQNVGSRATQKFPPQFVQLILI